MSRENRQSVRHRVDLFGLCDFLVSLSLLDQGLLQEKAGKECNDSAQKKSKEGLLVASQCESSPHPTVPLKEIS
jgi:hypothetical protein